MSSIRPITRITPIQLIPPPTPVVRTTTATEKHHEVYCPTGQLVKFPKLLGQNIDIFI